MNRRGSYVDEELGSSSTGMGRWILPALAVSLVIHFFLWVWATQFPIQRMSDDFYDRIVPRTFHLERAEIDPKLLEPAPDPETRVASAPTAVAVPDESVAFEKLVSDVRATPTAPKLDPSALAEKPSIDAPSFSTTMQTAESAGVRSLLPDESALLEELLQDTPAASATSIIELPEPGQLGGSAVTRTGSPAGSKVPGFSDLDDLLAQTGPLSPETAPILMPTDLLFDYNAADLHPQAVASLEKLGRLMIRNPNARFIIEGHTDSFGSDEYNNELSTRRADSVKIFLTNVLGVPGDRIETRGFGKSRLIAPATGTIEEQQINRRVEIVIRAPATP